MADAVATPTESEPAPVLREQATDALARLQAELGDAIVEHAGAFGDLVVRVRRDAWRRSAQVCKEKLGCDYLSFIAGIDWMPTPAVAEEGSGDTSTPAQPKDQTYGVAGSEGRYQLFALVESTRRKSWRVILKTDLPDADLHADSWVAVYPGADWHEREAWEMYGFVFDGHPSLRHLYLPSEFEGHPLRKDYPLLAREVKPWPGLVDVEPMPGEPADADADDATAAATAGESA
ncbi:MAG TPA: NADH-quinone oxidoreductase subunit C [Acidimicrobiia bacterium]|nr:NADH-quinone oxidoreductase subunit C [Acidimicrobiia bacterium]